MTQDVFTHAVRQLYRDMVVARIRSTKTTHGIICENLTSNFGEEFVKMMGGGFPTVAKEAEDNRRGDEAREDLP